MGALLQNMNTFLHVGCVRNTKAQADYGFNTDDWQELHFDINPHSEPDIIGTMTDMSAVEDESVDAIFSSHNIEHLYPYEVPLASRGFIRELRPNGYSVITCPDLQSVAKIVSQCRLTDPAYQSLAGPISGLDILYGYRTSLARGNLYMAHRCGFTQRSLAETLMGHGFRPTVVRQRARYLDLWAITFNNARQSEADMKRLTAVHFPI